ncbi:GlxA family transcriptional regulator [Actinoplanes sp. CA-030573]|uniref:GlxA family transcriptional regulator n=1 Tax=Actinoplanes sp. CA-030573 TaxID=3239898 RepID=UPI003D93DB84
MRNVAVLMPSTVRPFDLAVYCEVWDRPPFAFAICSERPGVPVPTAGGMRVTPAEDLDRLAAADVVAVAPPQEPARDVGPATREALENALARGARVVAAGAGAFLLAAAGLLDGRTVAAPGPYADRMRAWFPRVRIDPGARYRDDDPILTSAGTAAAGIDLCLHLIGKDHGAAAAAAVWSGMALGVARVAEDRRRRDDGVDQVLAWALGNLQEDLSIEVLARRAFLSTRSFARRFRAATGTTPYAWVLEQRIRLAQHLLETEPACGVEEAAGRAGFSSAALLRQHFQRRLGCSPSQYRQRHHERFAPSARG